MIQASPLTLPGPRFSTRLAALAAIFIVELLAVSVWLDGDMLAGRGGLAGVLHDWGAFTVRLAIASVLVFLVLGEGALGETRAASAPRPDIGRVSRMLLALHACAMAIFAALSELVYGSHPAGIRGDLAVIAWAATGLAAIVLAACAMIPAAVWIEKLHALRATLIFAPAAALAGVLLGNLARKLWGPLVHGTFAVVSAMLRPFLSELFIDPSHASIGSARFHVEIAPECSGYEGIGLILAVTCAWLWFLRREWRFPNALLLIPLGVAAVWILNAARIAALILLGNAGAEGIALGGFHSQAGWITFSVVSLGVCSVARRISWFSRAPKAGDAAAPRGANPVAVFIAPFLAILAAAMIARAASDGFEWLYGLRVAAAGAALWYFRGSYRELEWRPGAFAFFIGAIVFAMWIALDRFSSLPAAAPAAFVAAPPAAKSAWIALRLAGAVATVPIAEELAFRGYLLRRLVSADFESVPFQKLAWMPLVISSLAFGILHGDRWIAGTVAGLLYAFALIRRGRIGDAVAAHAFTNALLAGWVLATGNWQLW